MIYLVKIWTLMAYQSMHRAPYAPLLSYLTLHKVSAPNIKMQKAADGGASYARRVPPTADACEVTTFDCDCVAFEKKTPSRHAAAGFRQLLCLYWD